MSHRHPEAAASAARAVSIGSCLLACAASIAFCAGTLEIAARVAAWHRRSAPRTRRSFLEYDADLGWHKAAGEEVWLFGEGGPVLFRTDANGMRGPDRSVPKTPGTTRVLLLGDSFVEAGTVAEEASVRAQLERIANSRSACGRFEVVAAGTSGYSTDQEYLFFERDGVRYQPDEVALFFFSNDLQGNTATRKKPWFDLDDGRLQLHNEPVPAPSTQHLHFAADPLHASPAWRGSQALRWMGDRTERSIPQFHAFLARMGLVPPAPDHPPTRDWLLAYGPDSDVLEHRWQVTLSLLDALHASVASHGASLVVFYVPAGFEIDAGDWDRTRARWGLGGEGWAADRVARRLERACRARAIPFVDPRPALAQAQDERRRPYFRDDPHWTAVGHEVAAEALAPLVEPDAACVPTERDLHPSVHSVASSARPGQAP